MAKIYKLDLKGAAGKLSPLYDNLPQKLKLYVDNKKSEKGMAETLGCLYLLNHALIGTGYSLSDLYYDENGKPKIDGIYFSLAHSKGFCVCAVGEREIGIDIEKIEPKPRLSLRLFGEKEREYAAKSYENFYEIWTKKESAAKLSGGGIKDFKNIDVFSKKYKFSVETIGDFIITLCELND